MKKVLITGGSGFIGNNIYKVFVNEPRLKIFNPDLKSLDLLDSKMTLKYFKQVKPDVIIHCAAILPKYLKSEKQIYESNILMTKNLIDASRFNKNIRIIFASGTSLYSFKNKILNEESPLISKSGYVKSKIDSEKMLQNFFSNCLILRISAPYGSDQKIKTVIHKFIIKAINNDDIVLFKKGKRIQFFTHIDDVVSSFLIGLKTNIIGVFNVCPDESISMLDLANMIIRISKSNSIINFSNHEDCELDYYIANQKSKDVLNWYPKVNLEEGIKSLIYAYRNFL